MKKLIVALVLLALSAVVAGNAFADLKVVQDCVVHVNGERVARGTLTAYFKADRARMEEPHCAAGDEGTVTIFRLDKGVMWTLDTEDETYTERAFDQMRLPPEKQGIETQVLESDEEKEVRGYQCRKIMKEISADGAEAYIKYDAWATRDIEIDADVARFIEKAVEASKGIPTLQASFEIRKDLVDAGLFPVKEYSETKMPKRTVTVRTILESVSTDKLDDSLFEIPEGYEKKRVADSK